MPRPAPRDVGHRHSPGLSFKRRATSATGWHFSSHTFEHPREIAERGYPFWVGNCLRLDHLVATHSSTAIDVPEEGFGRDQALSCVRTLFPQVASLLPTESSHIRWFCGGSCCHVTSLPREGTGLPARHRLGARLAVRLDGTVTYWRFMNRMVSRLIRRQRPACLGQSPCYES